MWSRAFLLIAITAPWLGLACGDEAQVFQPGATSSVGAGSTSSGSGGEGDAGGDEGSGGAPPPVTPSPVRLGLVTNTPGLTANAAERSLAELTALAAGVRVVSITVPWRDLDELARAQIATQVADHVAQEIQVVINLLVVDGVVDERPDAYLGQPWSDASVASALSQDLDDLVTATGSGVAAIVLGRRVDAYLAAYPDEADALEDVLTGALTQLEAAPPLGAVGLSFIEETRLEDAPEELRDRYQSLAEASPLLALDYLPGLGDEQAGATVAHAKALDRMIARAEERPILIHGFGYPSGDSLGSSGEAQAQQLDTFFEALEPRRAHFPWVFIRQLADFDAEACDALTAAQGFSPTDPETTHWCSLGLRDVTGEPKPAWTRFVQAAAHLASP
ncbi:MAG: hypothetical protein R3B72_51115 [Polyangiaceae bacterium]